MVVISGRRMTGAGSWRTTRAGRWGLALAASLLALLTVLLVIGLVNAQAMPITRQTSVPMPGLASGTPAIQLALLSDIHLGNRGMEPRRLDDIVDQVNAARPDLILIAGDFVTGHRSDGAAQRAAGLTAPLSRLRATYGVIAVLGNHDHWTDPDAVRSALEKAGVVILENQTSRRGPLAIVGVGDRFSGHDDLTRAVAGARSAVGVPVILTHSPDIVPDLPVGFPLVLAGHTHCGQVTLPWFGPLLNHAPLLHWRRIYDPRYRCGVIQDTDRVTVVTAGVGSGSLPIRIGAMPDWWLVTLTPQGP